MPRFNGVPIEQTTGPRFQGVPVDQPSGGGSLAEPANAFLGGIIEGVPVVGPYIKEGMDRVGAAGRALMNDTKYSDELNFIHNRTGEIAKEHPYLSTAGAVTGAVAGTIPLVMAAPAAFGAGSGPLLLRSGAALASGTALGAGDAAVRSGGDPDAIKVGGAVGGVMGGLGPSIAGGVGRIARALLNRGASPGQSLAGVSRPALNYATGTVVDPAKRAAMQTEMQRLGPEATLADVSPEWMGVARGAASRPGQRDLIVNALMGRDAGKNARINSALDENLGQAPVPSQIDAQIREAQNALGPQYQQALVGAKAVDTRPIADRLDTLAIDKRGAGQEAAKKLREMLNIPGTDELDPSPRTLLSVRHAIDGMKPGELNGDVKSVLTEARKAIDEELAAKVPGIKDIDAQYAELARQSEGLERGGQVLDGGKSTPRPTELAQEVQQRAVPQGNMVGPSAVPLRMREGARAEIDRIVGTNANDVAALNRLMRGEGDWNRQKLATLFGQEKADRILGVLDAEQRFQQTAGRVAGGSDTAMANRFGDFLDQAATPSQIPMDTGLTGLGLRIGQRVAGAGSKARAEKNADRFASELGRLAVAQGGERDATFRAIVDLLAKTERGRAAGDKTATIARLLLSSTPAISNQMRQTR